MEEGKAYIESGILELYVLGELSTEEQQEVEAMAIKYPEVKQEITAIEIAMENYALHHVIQPSKGLEDKILQSIGTPAVTAEPVKQEVPQKTETAKEATVVALNTTPYETKIRNLRIALTACAVLLLITVVALFTINKELGKTKEEVIALNLDKQKFSSTVGYMKEANNDLKQLADMANDPDWKTVKLAGTKMNPKAKLVVYWHTSGHHVMVDNTKMELPKNDEAHQYQLWAIVNGKPVDLGVFDADTDTAHVLLKMKEIGEAQAFAVTLEKRGGVASPTMEQMIVMAPTSI